LETAQEQKQNKVDQLRKLLLQTINGSPRKLTDYKSWPLYPCIDYNGIKKLNCITVPLRISPSFLPYIPVLGLYGD